MKFEELLLKIKDLKDLKQAISLVKENPLEKKDLNAQAPQGQQEQPGQQGQQAWPTGVVKIKHLGKIHTNGDITTHRLGARGTSLPYEYAIDHNAHHEKGGLPAYTAYQVNREHGHAIGHAPHPFKSASEAAKSVLHHASTGEWL